MEYKQGDKLVVQHGEFRGTILMVDRVYEQGSGLVVLQTLDQDTLQWVDFCSESPAEVARLTRRL